MNLDDLKRGQQVFIDSNIFLAASFQKSRQCVRLIERCFSGDIKGLLPIHIAAEINHRLMCSEARQRAGGTLANPAKALAGNPQRVRELQGYRKLLANLLEGAFEVVPLAASDMMDSLEIQARHGLLTNDALLLALARRIKQPTIASADAAFKDISGLIVYAPSDLTP